MSDPYIVRAPHLDEAEQLMAFGNRLLEETPFYLRSPGERANTVAEMENIIRWYAETPAQMMLNAYHEGEPVGEAVIMGGRLKRTARTALIGIGVLKAHHGTGLGRRMMASLEEFALRSHIHRLELTVLSTNPLAREFYHRQGYQHEGVKRDAALIDGAYVDEEMMAKLLPVLPEPDGTG